MKAEFLAFVSLVAMLTGCALEHTSPESKALAAIPDKSSGIVTHKTSREAVREKLGKPLYASDDWRFDLFQSEASQSQTVYAITPWPIPFAHLTDDLRRYTLVTYDEAKRVSCLKSGVFRKVPNWRSVSPIQNDYVSLRLNCNGITLLMDRGLRGENLLVGGAMRDAYLRRLGAASNGTLVIGAGTRGLGLRLSVDGGKTISLPTLVPQHQGEQVLVVHTLPAGDHELLFSTKYWDGTMLRKVALKPGDVTYLRLDFTGTVKDKTMAWKLDQWKAMPREFGSRPLLLVHDGEWQLDAQP